MADRRRRKRDVFKRRGDSLTEWKRKRKDVSADPEEGLFSGDDEIDAPPPTPRASNDLSGAPEPSADPADSEDDDSFTNERFQDILDDWYPFLISIKRCYLLLFYRCVPCTSSLGPQPQKRHLERDRTR